MSGPYNPDDDPSEESSQGGYEPPTYGGKTPDNQLPDQGPPDYDPSDGREFRPAWERPGRSGRPKSKLKALLREAFEEAIAEAREAIRRLRSGSQSHGQSRP